MARTDSSALATGPADGPQLPARSVNFPAADSPGAEVATGWRGELQAMTGVEGRAM
ncbi:hypothetical protein ACN24M_02425 [Streptomyces microflavus]